MALFLPKMIVSVAKDSALPTNLQRCAQHPVGVGLIVVVMSVEAVAAAQTPAGSQRPRTGRSKYKMNPVTGTAYIPEQEVHVQPLVRCSTEETK